MISLTDSSRYIDASPQADPPSFRLVSNLVTHMRAKFDLVALDSRLLTDLAKRRGNMPETEKLD